MQIFLTLNSSETEFLLIILKNNLPKFTTLCTKYLPYPLFSQSWSDLWWINKRETWIPHPLRSNFTSLQIYCIVSYRIVSHDAIHKNISTPYCIPVRQAAIHGISIASHCCVVGPTIQNKTNLKAIITERCAWCTIFIVLLYLFYYFFFVRRRWSHVRGTS